jgi:hypothetical protein
MKRYIYLRIEDKRRKGLTWGINLPKIKRYDIETPKHLIAIAKSNRVEAWG